tara:strand:+ start:1355 stop:1582 length:228 start_codon:yes stop_codon:yes gene_type:complete
MKSPNELKRNVGIYTETDKRKINQLKQDLDSLASTGRVGVEGVKILFNIQTQVHVLLEQYNNRLVMLLKQNHMID